MDQGLPLQFLPPSPHQVPLRSSTPGKWSLQPLRGCMRGGGAEREEESGPKPGGVTWGWGVGVADTGKWGFALLFFFFFFSL